MEDNKRIYKEVAGIALLSYIMVMVMLISTMIELRHVKNDMDNLRYEIQKLKDSISNKGISK
jgi:hypothetical protein